MGFSRQEFWSALPFPSPGDLPNPGIEPTSLTSTYIGKQDQEKTAIEKMFKTHFPEEEGMALPWWGREWRQGWVSRQREYKGIGMKVLYLGCWCQRKRRDRISKIGDPEVANVSSLGVPIVFRYFAMGWLGQVVGSSLCRIQGIPSGWTALARERRHVRPALIGPSLWGGGRERESHQTWGCSRVWQRLAVLYFLP